MHIHDQQLALAKAWSVIMSYFKTLPRWPDQCWDFAGPLENRWHALDTQRNRVLGPFDRPTHCFKTHSHNICF